MNSQQKAMLAGEFGTAKQMAMRLLLDLAATSGAKELVPIQSAHLSGVSPLTGGLGLRLFLAKLAAEPGAQVAVPTTLNSAGCDVYNFEAMRIAVPGFLEQSQEIVANYAKLGVNPTQSCIPYEWDGVVTEGTAAWAESNAICFGNSYCGLLTNRESGLSALASALTGYTPKYGLLEENARRPNLEIRVTCRIVDPTDFSILGDWIGKQRQPGWRLPYGPIPLIRGLPTGLTHEQRKALTAAAANYGSPLVYIDGQGEIPPSRHLEASLEFSGEMLRQRYTELQPRNTVSLITLGCPQASVGELRAMAELLKDKEVASAPDDGSGLPPLWIFTSSANRAIAERTGIARIIRRSGALLLENTCPEVVPYDQRWVNHILTNSMKAEHYIKSGLNGIPTSVMRLTDCIGVATGELALPEAIGQPHENTPPNKTAFGAAQSVLSAPSHREKATTSDKKSGSGSFVARGSGLPSQGNFSLRGQAFVTDTPITFLGFVDRKTGVIREPGHPADGKSMAGKIAIFPKGTGSTVAPYVLLELFYQGKAPIAIINTDIDQQSTPACSLEGIPYGYDFDRDLIAGVRDGDWVELERSGTRVTLRVVSNLESTGNWR